MNITPTLRKYVMPNMPYLMFLWFFAKVASAYRLAPGIDVGAKLMGSMSTLGTVMAQPLSGFAATDLLIGIVGAVIVRAVVYFKGKNAKKYRKGIEYGSARCRA